MVRDKRSRHGLSSHSSTAGDAAFGGVDEGVDCEAGEGASGAAGTAGLRAVAGSWGVGRGCGIGIGWVTFDAADCGEDGRGERIRGEDGRGERLCHRVATGADDVAGACWAGGAAGAEQGEGSGRTWSTLAFNQGYGTI